MFVCPLLRVRAWYVFRVCSYSVIGGYYSNLVYSLYSGHYKDSTLLLCTHIVGRFFARVYLYIG